LRFSSIKDPGRCFKCAQLLGKEKQRSNPSTSPDESDIFSLERAICMKSFSQRADDIQKIALFLLAQDSSADSGSLEKDLDHIVLDRMNADGSAEKGVKVLAGSDHEELAGLGFFSDFYRLES
jgi:hypothetical protein